MAQWLSSSKMDSALRVQIQNETIGISHSKGWGLIILPQANGRFGISTLI